MSQALARLEMRLHVTQRDVDEAIRLVAISKASVLESDGPERGPDADYVSRIWALLRDRALGEKRTYVTLDEARALVTGAGLSTGQLDDMVAEYEGLGLLEVNASRTRVDFVMAAA